MVCKVFEKNKIKRRIITCIKLARNNRYMVKLIPYAKLRTYFSKELTKHEKDGSNELKYF